MGQEKEFVVAVSGLDGCAANGGADAGGGLGGGRVCDEGLVLDPGG